MSKSSRPADSDTPLSRSPEIMTVENSALLVVDAQGKLLANIPERAKIVWNIRRLLDAAAIFGVPMAGTEQYPDRLGPTVPELKERLGPLPDKIAFSACVCREIFDRWQEDQRDRVLICGTETHICILQTAFDLTAAGFSAYVAVDAVGSRHMIDHETALRRLESAGIVLTTTEAAMFEWCGAADVPQFKQISALAKEPPPR
jgi:nicotinamidase-related amidase